VTFGSTIRELDIGPERPSEGPQLTGQLVGAVVAGDLVAFGEGLGSQHQKDVLQSLLLAQLGASAKVDRLKDPSNWMRQYLSILEQIAWVTTTAYSATKYLPQVSSFGAAALIQDTFRRKLLDYPAEVSTTLAAYRSDTGSAQVVFECPSHSGGLANFQVAYVTEDGEGDVVMWVASASFNAPQHFVQLFEGDLPPGTQAQVGWTVLRLNESVFSKLRSSLDTKLQGRYATSVVGLPAQ